MIRPTVVRARSSVGPKLTPPGWAATAECLGRVPERTHLGPYWRVYFRHRSGRLGYVDAPGYWLPSPFGAPIAEAHDWMREQPGGMNGWWLEGWQPLIVSSICANGKATVSWVRRALWKLTPTRRRTRGPAAS